MGRCGAGPLFSPFSLTYRLDDMGDRCSPQSKPTSGEHRFPGQYTLALTWLESLIFGKGVGREIIINICRCSPSENSQMCMNSTIYRIILCLASPLLIRLINNPLTTSIGPAETTIRAARGLFVSLTFNDLLFPPYKPLARFSTIHPARRQWQTVQRIPAPMGAVYSQQ